VGISAAISILVAVLFGALSPLLFQRLHLDPNMATGPLVSTVVDALGLAIYFSIASGLINILEQSIP
jgi:magnesium transporter